MKLAQKIIQQQIIDDFMKNIINEVVDNLSSKKKGIGLDADNDTKNKRGNCSC